MKKYFLSLVILAVSAVSFTSCLDSDNSDQNFTYTYGGNECFNRVVERGTTNEIWTKQPSYTFKYNVSKSKIDVQMSGITLGDDYKNLSFALPTLSFTQNNKDGFIETSGRDILPVTPSPYAFDVFKLRSYPARAIYINGKYVGLPVYDLSYTIQNTSDNSIYDVTVYPVVNAYLGATNSYDLENSSQVFVNKENLYQSPFVVEIDYEKKTAKMYVYNAKFKKDKNPTTFSVKDLPVTFTSDGYSISTPSDTQLPIINSQGNTIEGRTISGISITARLNYGATIMFECDLGEDGKFRMVAPLRYLLYANQDNED